MLIDNNTGVVDAFAAPPRSSLCNCCWVWLLMGHSSPIFSRELPSEPSCSEMPNPHLRKWGTQGHWQSEVQVIQAQPPYTKVPKGSCEISWTYIFTQYLASSAYFHPLQIFVWDNNINISLAQGHPQFRLCFYRTQLKISGWEGTVVGKTKP